MPDQKRQPLKTIKSGALSRGWSLARVTVSAGAKAASYAVGDLLSGNLTDEEKQGRKRALLTSQLELLTQELGALKGSLMKVGQMLSMVGEHFLPPEANKVLKSLQSNSPPLAWPEVEKVLRRQFGKEKLALLKIDPTPIASASLGQVHSARIQGKPDSIALKIQYPGVDQAVESDLAALRNLLRVTRLLPKGPNYEEIFREVKSMLHQEVDYLREKEATEFFRSKLASDPRYVVAQTYSDFCTRRVLALSMEEGLPVDSPEVLGLSQERRNALGATVLDLYFRELFEFRLVQTDPHFGNYRIRLGQKPGELDRLVLFDFGAVRHVPDSFFRSYRKLVQGAFEGDDEMIRTAALKMGFLMPDDPPELVRHFLDLCLLILEPFRPPYDQTPYDWGASDLPKRVTRQGAKIIMSFRLRVPPREVVFLDRKMGGMFIFLQVLKARIGGREILARYLGLQPN